MWPFTLILWFGLLKDQFQVLVIVLARSVLVLVVEPLIIYELPRNVTSALSCPRVFLLSFEGLPFPPFHFRRSVPPVK